MSHLRFHASLAALALATVATLGAVAPADAAGALTCPTAPGTPPTADRLTRPAVDATLAVKRPDGLDATAYSDLTVPQAVVDDPATGHAFVAYYAPADPGQPAHPVVSEVDRAGNVVSASVLTDGLGGTTADLGAHPQDDSNNGLTIAIDAAGYIHVAGNMRPYRPMGYWRSAAPHSAAVMLAKPQLPGLVYNTGGVAILAASAERVSSDPVFFTAADGTLYFGFTHYETGQGDFYLLRYDAAGQRWINPSGGVDLSYGFTDTNAPLLAGYSSSVSPAVRPIVAGPDGWYWLSWSWRDDAGPDTNSRLSVAKTKDFTTWYTATGKPLPSSIPYSLVDTDPSYAGLVVADLPRSGSGSLSNQFALAVAGDGSPVAVYYAASGSGATKRTLLYVARGTNQGKWIDATPVPLSGFLDMSQLGGDVPLTIDGTPTPVAGSTDLLVDLTCGGKQLQARVAVGAMGTYSTLADLKYRTAAPLPLAAEEQYPSSVGFSIVARTATSPRFVDADGVTRQWVLKWDAGAFIVDGSEPTGTYSPYGSLLTLFLIRP